MFSYVPDFLSGNRVTIPLGLDRIPRRPRRVRIVSFCEKTAVSFRFNISTTLIPKRVSVPINHVVVAVVALVVESWLHQYTTSPWPILSVLMASQAKHRSSISPSSAPGSRKAA